MLVDDALIEKLAILSKLEFDENGKQAIKNDVSKILSFMAKLDELNTDGIEPLIYINEDINVMRDDIVKYDITKQEALQNAPLKNDDYIKVPKFVKNTN